MKLLHILVIFFVIIVGNLPGQHQNEYLILRSCPGAGMFAVVNEVIAMVKAYDQGLIGGCSVDFSNGGVYYDQNKGLNWWQYYCLPIKLGDSNDKKVSIICRNHPLVLPEITEYQTTKEEAHRLVKKYIHLQPYLEKEIESFANTEFKDHFIIGVHYRGTDKAGEAPLVPFSTVVDVINDEIKKIGNNSYKIFVATDEEPLLQHLISTYGNKVCYIKEEVRSKNGQPLHMKNEHPFIHGKYAFMDAVLLSKSKVLIRTSSNLSLFSTYLNPALPTILLNDRTVEGKENLHKKL